MSALHESAWAAAVPRRSSPVTGDHPHEKKGCPIPIDAHLGNGIKKSKTQHMPRAGTLHPSTHTAILSGTCYGHSVPGPDIKSSKQH